MCSCCDFKLAFGDYNSALFVWQSILQNAIIIYMRPNQNIFILFQGYYYLSPSGKKKTMLCLACGRSVRAEKGLKQLLPGLPFLCASASKTQKPFSHGPFKVMDVATVCNDPSSANTCVAWVWKLWCIHYLPSLKLISTHPIRLLLMHLYHPTCIDFLFPVVT